MITEPVDDAGAVLAAARAGCRESTGQALERFRRYLLAIANHQLDPELRAKGGASDLVQETFLEAQRDLQRFQGSSTEELRAWLRQILVHNVGAFSRRFRVAEMRTVARGPVAGGRIFVWARQGSGRVGTFAKLGGNRTRTSPSIARCGRAATGRVSPGRHASLRAGAVFRGDRASDRPISRRSPASLDAPMMQLRRELEGRL